MALSKPTIWILLFWTEIFVFYILTLLLSAQSCVKSVIQDLDAYLMVFSDHRLKYDLEFFCRLRISQCTANTPLIVVTVNIIWNKWEMFEGNDALLFFTIFIVVGYKQVHGKSLKPVSDHKIMEIFRNKNYGHYRNRNSRI